jgi:hypothetical protein
MAFTFYCCKLTLATLIAIFKSASYKMALLVRESTSIWYFPFFMAPELMEKEGVAKEWEIERESGSDAGWDALVMMAPDLAP